MSFWKFNLIFSLMLNYFKIKLSITFKYITEQSFSGSLFRYRILNEPDKSLPDNLP